MNKFIVFLFTILTLFFVMGCNGNSNLEDKNQKQGSMISKEIPENERPLSPEEPKAPWS